MPRKPPPPIPAPKPAPKKRQKTPAEKAAEAEAVARERRKIRDVPAEARQSAQRSVLVSQEKERITKAEFRRQWGYYNTIYQDYAGRNASRGEALALIRNGVSSITLAKHLAKQPAFYKSPIWKANSDKFYGPAKNMGMAVDKKFIAQAIANNWDPYVFQEKLRGRPGYVKSTEYKTTAAGFTNAYRALYGDPTPEWEHEIKRVTLGRWTPEQWVAKLRADPAYRQSSEYQTKQTEFKSLLGF